MERIVSEVLCDEVHGVAELFYARELQGLREKERQEREGEVRQVMDGLVRAVVGRRNEEEPNELRESKVKGDRRWE